MGPVRSCRFSLRCAAASACWALLLCGARAQSTVTFSVANGSHAAYWPITVKGISVNGQPVELNQPVTVTGNWLSTVVVTVENVSTKDIVRGTALLLFPQSGQGTPASPYTTSWSYVGQLPDVALYQADGSRYEYPAGAVLPEAISIPPGGAMSFPFAEDGNAVQAELAAKGMPITQVNLQFQGFYFGDDSRWTGEKYETPPDPAPGNWTVVSRKQFLGNTPPSS